MGHCTGLCQCGLSPDGNNGVRAHLPRLRRSCGNSRSLRLQAQEHGNQHHVVLRMPPGHLLAIPCGWNLLSRSARCFWGATALDPSGGVGRHIGFDHRRTVDSQGFGRAVEQSGRFADNGVTLQVDRLRWECNLNATLCKSLQNVEVDLLLGIECNGVIACVDVIDELEIKA